MNNKLTQISHWQENLLVIGFSDNLYRLETG
jgi:hypothetical protein